MTRIITVPQEGRTDRDLALTWADDVRFRIRDERIMAGWGCPHNADGNCRKVPGKKCDPGMKGCVLFGKFSFSSEEKNISRRIKEKKSQEKQNEK